MKKIAFMFPGQGAQAVGMGLDLYNNSAKAKEIFETANQVLNKDIKKLCFEGPEEELKQTKNTQSCLLTVSIAAYSAFVEKTNGSILPDYTLGHSLGEYSAMYAAGVMDLSNVLRAIQKRSECMQNACAVSGTMAAILGADLNAVKTSLEEAQTKGLVSIANYNDPSQIVITGEVEAVNYACALIKEKGAKRVVPLAVSGGFHSKLMQSATDEFENFVKTLEIKNASIPVVTNVDAEFTTGSADFIKKMPEQISNSVYWVQSVQKLLDNGVDTFIEFGSGKVLSGLNRKICNDGVKTYNVSDTASLNATVEALELASV
ncbi:MAG: ACP S-malonyltransferase [Candidatus Gastranaerophilales bacterium]|nr:ACP S-malonyltransferase [Candidatus Gastranaerophilales bacterium]